MRSSKKDRVSPESSSSLLHSAARDVKPFFGSLSRVVDGDTLDVMVSLGFGVFSLVRFRLARIDAPELKTPAGKALKERLSQLVSKDVTLSSYGRDRYGRWIAEIWFAEFGNVSDWLLEQKLVEKYGG